MTVLRDQVAALVARQREQQSDVDRVALQVAYQHMPEPFEAAFARLACEHPEGCSCPEDYPGWTPGGTR
ncbi:MAG TPA: hypothetical protein VJX92_14635 [Methylomirabilota bacterium]|nr:hypothetical protein [Methylomirabilota bacterium]